MRRLLFIDPAVAKRPRPRVRLAALGILAGALSTPTGSHADPGSNLTANRLETVGLAQPSQIAALACVQQARIAEVLVKEGDSVKVGALLVQMDAGFQRARTEFSRAEAESTLSVELAKARWEHADRNWKRLQSLHGGDFASSKELTDAYFEADTRRLEYELSRLAHEQSARVFQRERELLAQLEIRAPFGGYISKIHHHPGEVVDVGDPILTIARLEELQVVATCPLNWAKHVQPGSPVRIRAVDPEWGARMGTVLFANRVSDAGSQTFELRVTVDNRDGAWLSGLKVTIELANNSRVGNLGEQAHRGPTLKP